MKSRSSLAPSTSKGMSSVSLSTLSVLANERMLERSFASRQYPSLATVVRRDGIVMVSLCARLTAVGWEASASSFLTYEAGARSSMLGTRCRG